MTIFSDHIAKIKKACQDHHVRSLFAFGSAVNGPLKANSDIDLIVDIESTDPVAYSDAYFGLKFQLEKILKREIDLLEKKTLKNPHLKRSIEGSKVLLYGKAD